MPYTRKKPSRFYFRFEGKLYNNPTSNNLIGMDEFPKFYIEGKKLLEALYWSKDPKSINRGYWRDHTLGFYVKNIHDMSDDQVAMEFWDSMSKAPYGYTDVNSYNEYVGEVFNQMYQGSLQNQWRELSSEGKIINETKDELAHAVLDMHHTVSFSKLLNRDEYYVPGFTNQGLPKI